jgi:hypothetical protein
MVRHNSRLVADGVGLLEFEPELLVRLPDQFAGPRRAVVRNHKMKVFRNSKRTFHLDGRAVVGNPAHDAIDDRLAEIADNLAEQRGLAVMVDFSLWHAQHLLERCRRLETSIGQPRTRACLSGLRAFSGLCRR